MSATPPITTGFNKKTVRDLQAQGKRVLVRCDFNVPMANGKITDDRRIREALRTIRYLVDHGAMVILCSHLGRPKGVTEEFSLAPIAEHLSTLLDQVVTLLPDCVGPQVQQACAAMKPREIVLLENVRFHPEEEANDPGFAQQLASLADAYVNDAFGTAHRAHASTAGVAQYLPGYAGFLMEKEIEYLGNAVTNPKHPFVAILGGSKVKDKIALIDNLLPKVDRLLIGGGMAFTFIKAQGHEIGKSLLDETNIDYARTLLERNADKIVLPSDFICGNDLTPQALTSVTRAQMILPDEIGGDIGPATRTAFADIIRRAATVLWNGPMGVFEVRPYEEGTRAIAQSLSECPGLTIVGGGDSAAAIEKYGFAEQVSHVSTGGGASLEFLEGKELPGIAALQDA